MSAQADQPAAFLTEEERQALVIPVASAARSILHATAVSAYIQTLTRESATPFSFSFPSAPAVQRRSVAERFARLARDIQGVEEVWLDGTLPDLEVSVVMRDVGFERELELRGIFIDLVCESLDPSVGELSVYAQTEDVPDSVRGGLQLA